MKVSLLALSRLAVAALLVLVLVAASASGAARASAEQQSDYTLASISISEGFGPVTFTYVDARLCLPPFPPLIGLCIDLPSLTFSPITTSGTTIWTDESSPNFNLIAQELTNGVLAELEWELDFPGGGGFGREGTEAELLGDWFSANRVDLAGFTIDRIGFRVDAVTFDQNFTIQGAFLFNGRLNSREGCMGGGWQIALRPDGSPFDNQGECMRFVATG